MIMTRAEQKNELMVVLQDAPIMLVERFKRDFERKTFNSDIDFNDWMDNVCLKIDQAVSKSKSLKRKVLEARAEQNKQQKQTNTSLLGLENVKRHQQRIRGLSK